ncbi:MAG: ATP-binding cassette domain-containing protein [Elusimicrobia bacterium]|nr:ATP-binding cassette domain-containing protein [Elusimicrobiota bacterium]
MSVLELRGVTVKDGEQVLFSGLDLTLADDERLVVFGPSGSGKRALLKLAAGIIVPNAGTARLGERAARAALPVGFVPEEGGLLSNMTLAQNVALPVVYHGRLAPRAALGRARELLAGLGAQRDAERRPALASIAGRRLAHLARAFLAEPALIVLEGPLDELDARAANTVRRALDGLTVAAIVGTASVAPYLSWGRRFLFLHGGVATLFSDREALTGSKDPALREFLEG